MNKLASTIVRGMVGACCGVDRSVASMRAVICIAVFNDIAWLCSLRTRNCSLLCVRQMQRCCTICWRSSNIALRSSRIQSTVETRAGTMKSAYTDVHLKSNATWLFTLIWLHYPRRCKDEVHRPNTPAHGTITLHAPMGRIIPGQD